MWLNMFLVFTKYELLSLVPVKFLTVSLILHNIALYKNNQTNYF